MEPDQQSTQAPEQQPAQAPAASTPVDTPVQAQPTAVAGVDPGHGLGVASLVTALLGMSLIGLILGIIGKNKSKKAGFKNGLATVGIVISSIGLALGLIIGGIMAAGAIALVAKCNDLGPGVHYENGTTITCN